MRISEQHWSVASNWKPPKCLQALTVIPCYSHRFYSGEYYKYNNGHLSLSLYYVTTTIYSKHFAFINSFNSHSPQKYVL